MAEQGRTLWDRLTGANKPVANEDKYHNPFKARVGNTFHLDILDHRKLFYTLKSFEVIDRGTGVLMTDYRLEAKPFGESEAKTLLLRTVPREGKTGASKIDFRIVALQPFFECGHDDTESYSGIMEGVNDRAGEFVINAGTTDERRFWRLQSLKSSEHATVTILKDDSGDGVVQDEEIETKLIEVWGFSRTTLNEAKEEVNEYLYVQKDKSSGWIEILIGTEIPPERIIV